MKRTFWCICLVVVTMMACHRPQGVEKTEEEKETLACIDDSVEAMSPHALHLIGEAMSTAADSMSYYELFVRKAKYFCLSTTPDSLYPVLDSTIAFCKRQPVTERRNSLLAFAYNCKAIAYHNYRRSPQQVISLYKKAQELLAKSDCKDQMPKVCANLGDAYIFQNQLPEAAAWYRRALFLVDSLGLPPKENITLYLGLATIYLQLNDFDTSLRYYQQTGKQFSQMTVAMQGYYLNNFGSYYYYAHDYKASLEKFLRLKAFLEKYNKLQTFDMYLCKLNLSDVYLNLGDVAQSEKYLDEVEPIIKSSGDGVAAYYVNTIRIGQAVKRGDMARVRHILQSEKKAGHVEFGIRQIRNRYLRQYAETIGDYKGAYDNLREDVRQNDSLEHNRIKMRASEIMDRFAQDTLRLHHSLEMEHKNAEIQRAKGMIWAFIALLLIIGFGVALFVMHSRKRYAQARLRIMQQRLESVRNRISPHFVFNVLNDRIIRSDDKERDELLHLAKLIRANLDLACRQKISLREELDFVNRYVEVEKNTLDDDFSFEVKVADGVNVDEVYMPSMFVQILVENAFVHGLKGRVGNKSIRIQVTREGHATSILVCDNGPGFDIRSVGKKRTGLNVICQTIAVLNERNRDKMKFSVRNIEEQGVVRGCAATIVIPDGIKLFV